LYRSHLQPRPNTQVGPSAEFREIADLIVGRWVFQQTLVAKSSGYLGDGMRVDR